MAWATRPVVPERRKLKLVKTTSKTSAPAARPPSSAGSTHADRPPPCRRGRAAASSDRRSVIGKAMARTLRLVTENCCCTPCPFHPPLAARGGVSSPITGEDRQGGSTAPLDAPGSERQAFPFRLSRSSFAPCRLHIVSHPDYDAGFQPDHRFPMGKYPALMAQLMAEGLLARSVCLRPEPASALALARAHDGLYVEQVLSLAVPEKIDAGDRLSRDGARLPPRAARGRRHDAGAAGWRWSMASPATRPAAAIMRATPMAPASAPSTMSRWRRST